MDIAVTVAPDAGKSGIARPVADRIGSLDFVRGFALFGILLMNITAFGLSHAYSNPVNDGGSTGADLWSWIIIQVGFEGTQRGLFSLLFGAGIVLFTRRLEETAPAIASDIYMRRNLWLIAFGFFNVDILLWGGDILFPYGVTALFAYAFRKLAPRWLILIGLASLALVALHNLQVANDNLDAHAAAQSAQQAEAGGSTLTDEQAAAITTWKEMEADHFVSPEVVEQDIAIHQEGWLAVREESAALAAMLRTYFLYSSFGDIFGPMLIGMALLKLGVFTLERPVRDYVVMVLIAYGIGLPVNIYETRLIMDNDFSLLAFSQADLTYDLGRLAMMLGHLGLLLLIYRSGIFGWLRRSVSAVGQMALTSYLTHSLVCAIFFVGFGMYSQLQRHELYYVVGAICLTQLVISPIWLRHFRFGPMEWVWRSLTYWKRQPMRRVAR
jgi:uncharacterized protein